MKRTLVAVTFFLVLLGLWQLATMSGQWLLCIFGMLCVTAH
jgi:hypothetical protein